MPYPELNVHTIIVPQANSRKPASPSPLPDYFQSTLYSLNIDGLPQTKDSTLTTEIRQNALDKYRKLVHPDTVKLIHKLAGIPYSSALQERAGEFWDGNYLFQSQTYLKEKYHRNVLLDISKLIELGLIERTPKTIRKCHGYRVIDADLIEAYSQSIEIDTKKVWVDLPVSKKPNNLSDIAIQTGKNIPIGMMNMAAVTSYFNRKIAGEIDFNIEHLLLEIQYVEKAWLNQIRYNKETCLLIYKQSFTTSPTGGRPYATSGDQFISRDLKVDWFDIKDVFNYDFAGCHINLLNQIKPTYFANSWLNKPGFKQSLADKLNMPVELLKTIVLMVTYGAKTTKHLDCEIFKRLEEHYGNYQIAKWQLEKFDTETLEYQHAIEEWLSEIRANPQKYQKNAIGLVTTETKPQTLASHWLIGLEQKAINWISNRDNQRKGGYQVISHQFDGIATLGSISADLIEALRVRSGLSLVLKPFN